MNKLKIRYLPLAIVFLGIVLATVVIPFAFGKEETSNRTVIKTTTDFTPKPPAAAGKHALLIAIQDYDSGKTGFHSLKGPANDIQLIKGMLRERFGFQDGNFTILQDDQATHTNIESAFMILVQMVQPGDFVYIHYSGHGSQTADLNGDETSGKDQTWVSYGARASDDTHKDNYDVLDDEINTWLAALYAKTDQVVFVSDSCHSATVSKGFNLTRAIDDDDLPHILGQLPYTQLANHRGIRVGAARDDESAIDKRRDDGKYYGVFSWHWARNLQQAKTGNTWAHVYQRTYAQIEAERVVQRPQIEGERQKQVLGGDFIAQPPTIRVIPIDDDWVELKAGSLAGVTEGSVYRLYKPQHPDPQTLPRLTITKATTFISYGEPEPKGSFKAGDLVVEESHAYHFTPIKVTLEADFPMEKDKPLLQMIQTAFQTRSDDDTQPFPAYTLTDDPSNTDLRLHLLRPKHGQFIPAKANDPLPKSFPNQPPELWVLTPDQRLLAENLRIPFDNPARGVQLLQDNLNKLARIREIKGLQSRRGRKIPVTLQAHILSPVAFCQEGPNCLFLDGQFYRKANNYSLPEIQQLTLTSKQILTFTLRNEDKWVNYYCYILNIGPDGAIYSIFPLVEDIMEYSLVPAGKTRELFEEQIGLITGLAGEETIKFITSRYPIDVRLLEQEAFQQRGGQFNQLEWLLFGHAVHGERGSPMKRNDDWATGLVGFQVEE